LEICKKTELEKVEIFYRKFEDLKNKILIFLIKIKKKKKRSQKFILAINIIQLGGFGLVELNI